MSPKCKYGPDCKGQEMDLQGRFEADTVQAARGGNHVHRVYVCYQCGTVAVERSADDAGITWIYPDGNTVTYTKIGSETARRTDMIVRSVEGGLYPGHVDASHEVRTEEVKSAMLCEHANENPAVCNCPDDCYCKTHTCKDRPKPLTPVELEARLSQTLQDLLVAALEQRRDVARYLCVTGQSSSFHRKTENGWLTVEARLAPLEDEDKGDQ